MENETFNYINNSRIIYFISLDYFMSGVYRFRVGVRNLHSNPPGGNILMFAVGKSEFQHAAFLLNRDLFEYSGDGYVRRRGVGRDDEFDWDAIGEALNGTTYVSPDKLEQLIKDSGDWYGSEYDFMNHNCMDFVQFCLRKVGCSVTMSMKKGPVYRNQQNGDDCNIE